MQALIWRAIFFLALPSGLLGTLLPLMRIPRDLPATEKTIDVPGLCTMTVFLVVLLLALSQGQQHGWDSGYILGLLTISGLSLVLFIIVELCVAHPVVPLRRYRNVPFVHVHGCHAGVRGKLWAWSGRAAVARARWRAVDGVSLQVQAGETFGLVGESGCGKSTLGKTMLGLYQPTAGEVRFQGQTLSGLSKAVTRQVRRELQYVYQDPGASLDPWWTVGRSLHEPLRVHTCLSRGERQDRVEEMVTAVGLAPHHLQRYPHDFSGGQQRRLALARILVLQPRLIIFDEPTAGLDVSIQATILNLFQELKERFALTYVFISHDLGIIRLMCDRVTVMYLGTIVETGPTRAIFDTPAHPYTQALLAAVPTPEVGDWEGTLLQGEPPRPDALPSGCRFRLRCPYAQDDPCAQHEPALVELMSGQYVACHRAPRPAVAASGHAYAVSHSPCMEGGEGGFAGPWPSPGVSKSPLPPFGKGGRRAAGPIRQEDRTRGLRGSVSLPGEWWPLHVAHCRPRG